MRLSRQDSTEATKKALLKHVQLTKGVQYYHFKGKETL